MKRILSITLLICLLFTMLLPVTAAEELDETKVLDDLSKDSSFSMQDYINNPDITEIQLLTISESTDRRLFIYTVRPSDERFKDLKVKKISMYDDYSLNGSDFTPLIYDLELCDSNEVFDKYVVTNYVVSDEVCRYLNFVGFYRDYSPDVDVGVSGESVGGTINLKSIKIGQQYLKIWAWIWAYNFNVIAIVVEAFAYYFYFIAGFDFVSIYTQVLKLLMDASVAIDFLPAIFWIVVALMSVHLFRRSIGFKTLEHMELKDRGFINERPIVIMVCGTMGKKKTTLITDVALSQEIMLREKAFEKILECDLKFPFFPWIVFENELKMAMQNHSVYNLATARRFVKSKKRKFEKHPRKRYIFMYDFKKYGTDYDDNLKVTDIWEVLEIYAQLYFVYVIQSSLLISNYSIRSDNVLLDVGNFPMWNSELFEKDSRLIDAYSRHSHILDFDSLRLGKKLLEDNRFADSFEFGVINITEIGKERGNNLELQQVKKSDENCNQKNDLFNSWLKMVRHSATIDNFPFVKIICDEQRPESWGADARDLCEIVHIEECSERKLAMPLFALEELVVDGIVGKFVNKYYQHRFNRGDNTLLMYLFHALASWLNRYKMRTYNQFGYFKMALKVEQGRQDGDLKESKYYLMCKKIYSKRFSTDCFSDFFNEKALRSSVGLDDLPEFKTEKASFDELSSENSYFFNDLTKLR